MIRANSGDIWRNAPLMTKKKSALRKTTARFLILKNQQFLELIIEIKVKLTAVVGFIVR